MLKFHKMFEVQRIGTITTLLNFLLYPLVNIFVCIITEQSEVNFFKLHKKMETIVDGDICKNHNSSLTIF